jgi:hypothetical protein
MGAMPVVGVGPSGAATGVGPAAEVTPSRVASASVVGPSGAGPTTGVAPSRAARSVGKSSSGGSVGKTTLGGSMVALAAQELVRDCFGSDPIAYGEEKMFNGILVSLDSKNNLE